MCGIAGLVGTCLPGNADALIDRMSGSLARRGPDGKGLHRWPNAVFGHRRLAIIDLSDDGRQPMLSEDGTIGVVFNGAIYNFHALRHELEGKGYRFRSECDTEVLVHGYREWGIDALLPKLRGMFAIGIWDDSRRTLTLVRDRLGVKPLVYAIRDGQLAFASTITALHAAGFADDVDPASVLEVLEFGWVTNDRAIYRGVSKLPAATVLEWRDGLVSQREYWVPPEPVATGTVRFEDAVERTEHLLLEAVRIRLFADVPIGALLSAGIDSTLICWALAKLNANVKSFTVSTPGDPADEAEDARLSARVLGIPHQVIELPASEQPALDELIAAYDEPFACSSALGMLRVAKAVKPEATVLLTGDGGDDVFLGYPRHLHFWRAEQYANLTPAAAAAVWPMLRPATKRFPALRRATHFIDYVTGGLGAVTRVHDGLPYYERHRMLGDRLRRQSLSAREIPPSFSSARRLLADFLKYERRTEFVSEYMTKVDGATMFHAIEARSPFLDQHVWELAASLPYAIRLRGGELKAVLRALVRKNIGAEIAQRPKRYFKIPVDTWLVGAWGTQVADVLDSPLLESQGWLARGAIATAWQRARDHQSAPNQLWYLVVLENWLRRQARVADTRETTSVCPML